jgi:hypothetical protein
VGKRKNNLLIKMTQCAGVDELQTMMLHPSQLISACRDLGLITSDRQDKQVIRRLQRQFETLRYRTDSLFTYLQEKSKQKEPDLTWEMLYCMATLDIADEFCRDIELSM